MDLGKDLLLDMYRSMTRIRLFETQVRDLAKANEIPGFVHVSLARRPAPPGSAPPCARPIASPRPIAATAI